MHRESEFLDEPVRMVGRGNWKVDTNARLSVAVHENDEPFVHTFRHIWPLVFAFVFLGGTSFGISVVVKKYEIDPLYGNWTMAQYKEDTVLGERCQAVDHDMPWRELKRKLLGCRRGQYYDPLHDDCAECPAESPNDKVFSVFWETQSNCQHLVANPNTRFVTHVMWSFVEPAEDGAVPLQFQYWSQEHIKDCILQLRMRCIKNLVAIGGASARERFLGLKDPANLKRFKESSMKVIKEFGFDGIDVDDETGNMRGTHQDWLKYHGPVAVSYLQALRQGLDEIQQPTEPRYILSWDEFPSSWDPPNATNKDYPGCIIHEEGQDGWHRCYDPRITDFVDMVNVMFYNINGGNWVYEVVMKDTLPMKATKVIPTNKLILGACSGMGCVLEQPAGQEVFNAGNGSAYYKGTMLWSGTIDILFENSSCMSRMGRAGNYGVKMPFRSPLN
ncbi:hypothetical protein H310_00226 [Aphanomyces invadans]|uniref:GH18 domain-containing protein n=1 Tax=Aphanomyces invadans TaxID=157072 RepID=A0A024UUX7_9STRA|nr:hypothetical protein H310_00226 [Aphanomyces invadans]ETW09737.1 hypothetical protein H310_00226 [Aphanomyces invadans]|eukprot:XP_008861148.1 hypothetical protein H310_00226 [Aphanomyces invadans]